MANEIDKLTMLVEFRHTSSPEGYTLQPADDFLNPIAFGVNIYRTDGSASYISELDTGLVVEATGMSIRELITCLGRKFLQCRSILEEAIIQSPDGAKTALLDLINKKLPV